jgi:hypothetical protein
VCLGTGTRTIDVLFNDNLTIVPYNIVVSIIRRICGMKIIPSWRRSNYLTRFGAFLVMAVLIIVIPCSYGGCGDDTPPSQNLEIRTWYDLNAVRENMSGNHTLMNDLDSTTLGYTELAGPTADGGKGWDPIGYCTAESSGCSAYSLFHGLRGTLDGQGHEIRDLFINRPDENAVGLLAYLIEGGIIKDVGVVNVTVICFSSGGSLVGVNYGGTVSNCYSTGNVTAGAGIGGLVGHNSGTISNSYSTGSVSGRSSNNIGGLVGDNDVGGNSGTISNSYSTCSVTGNLDIGFGYIGGLVGENDGTVSSSFWDTETSGQSSSDGGRGKTTEEMQSIATFLDKGWDIIAVALNETNPTYIWNIVNNVTYPFLSWES